MAWWKAGRGLLLTAALALMVWFLRRGDTIVVGVFAGAINLEKRSHYVRETWARQFPLLIFGTNAPLTHPSLREHWDIVSVLGEGQRYYGIPKNDSGRPGWVVLPLLEKMRAFSAEWYVQADDDTYMFRDRLEKVLAKYDPAVPSILGCPCRNDNLTKPYFPGPLLLTRARHFPCGGGGFALSRALMDNLPDVSRCELFVVSDITLMECMHRQNISLTHERAFCTQRFKPKGWPNISFETSTEVAFHNIFGPEMYMVRQMYSDYIH